MQTMQRSDQVSRIRGEILAGTYDYAGTKLEIAAGRLADELLDAGRSEAPALPPGFACNDLDGLS